MGTRHSPTSTVRRHRSSPPPNNPPKRPHNPCPPNGVKASHHPRLRTPDHDHRPHHRRDHRRTPHQPRQELPTKDKTRGTMTRNIQERCPATSTKKNHHTNPRQSPKNQKKMARHRGTMSRHITIVGLTGFEPAASSSRTTRATKLRHSPFFELLPKSQSRDGAEPH